MRKVLSYTKSLTLRKLTNFSQINKFRNNFLSGENIIFLESLHNQWRQDKSSVSESLKTYFQLIQKGDDPQQAFNLPPIGDESFETATKNPQILKHLGLKALIDRYRSDGHRLAKLNPLQNLKEETSFEHNLRVLNLQEFGFSSKDLQDCFSLGDLIKQYQGMNNSPQTIKSLQNYLRKTYLGKVGYEYMHLSSKNQRDFIRNSIQKNVQKLAISEPSNQQRLQTFKRLCKDQCFTQFLNLKFSNYNRSDSDNLHSLTSALSKLVQTAADLDCQYLTVGMAHKGRLNVLNSVFQKSTEQIFKQLLNQPQTNIKSVHSSYEQIGFLNKKLIKGKQINLNILPNTSYTQSVYPLVYGSTRAIQESTKDKSKAMGILIYGQAAVACQGIVYESLQLQDLVDFTTGGTIHIVLNNQIGITTDPRKSRSSQYCTEVAKIIGAPVLHVNANEPDLLDLCVKTAVQYRQKFNKDIFIEISGHKVFENQNQFEEFLSQPQLYKKTKNISTVFDLYSKKCINAGVITNNQIETMRQKFMSQYSQAYEKAKNNKILITNTNQNSRICYKIQKTRTSEQKTGVQKNFLENIFSKISAWPKDFNLHPMIKKILDERIKNFTTNQNIDWATMQSLAFGSLLSQGYGIRLTGQDVQRGTFSHRHALVSDQTRDIQKHNFFKSINPQIVTISNSNLSEYAIVGFEYGFSITNPNTLNIWQAQFGDFANVAAIVVDNYLVNGQIKWGIQSGLVLNLPHGMDGGGPQHSTGRLQRFLQLSNDRTDIDQNLPYEERMKRCNLQIVTCSTASNYFHVLRRQLKRDYRKPLINLNSKKLLKFKGANRPVEDIVEEKEFQTVISDQKADPKKVQRVLLCNGQFYYELRDQRDQLKLENVAIVRIQQISPFPHEQLKKVIQKYDSNVIIDWVQQEHENYGAWNFLYPRLTKLFNKQIRYFGRKPAAATAAGAQRLHKIQEAQLLESLFPK